MRWPTAPIGLVEYFALYGESTCTGISSEFLDLLCPYVNNFRGVRGESSENVCKSSIANSSPNNSVRSMASYFRLAISDRSKEHQLLKFGL